jgi:ribonuclease VapC
VGGRALIVETSAIVAILLGEHDAQDLIDRVDAADKPVTSAINAFEAVLSIGRAMRNYELASELVPDLLASSSIEMVGVPSSIYDGAVAAYLRYGKGTGHPAKLNFGDCFSYAMAKRAGVPLLYKGDDFAQTDLA